MLLKFKYYKSIKNKWQFLPLILNKNDKTECKLSKMRAKYEN